MKNRLVALASIFTMTFGLAPVSFAAAAPFQAGQTGTVSGEVKEKCGQTLREGRRARLVDRAGTAVPGMLVAVALEGKFAFTNVTAGMYTVHIIGTPDILGILGMTAVTVPAGGASNAKVTVGDEECAGIGRNNPTKKILAAAAAGGVLAKVATRGDASPSR